MAIHREPFHRVELVTELDSDSETKIGILGGYSVNLWKKSSEIGKPPNSIYESLW